MSTLGCPLERPSNLEFNCFSDGQGIIEFHMQVSDSTVHLGVAEKKLNSSKVSGLLVDLGDLGSPHRMDAVKDATDINHPGIFSEASHIGVNVFDVCAVLITVNRLGQALSQNRVHLKGEDERPVSALVLRPIRGFSFYPQRHVRSQELASSHCPAGHGGWRA